MSLASTYLNPKASKQTDGRIAVFIGSSSHFLPHECALALFEQMGIALGVPTSLGVAKFAAHVLDWHRNDGFPGDVDGGDVQECALENGLIEPFTTPAGGCGEGCECEEGDRCYRNSAIGRALRQLLDTEPTTREVRL